MESSLLIKYQEIFETYLNFCPWYRRTLVDLNDIHSWLRDIDIRIGSNESDLYILMEWFNSTNLIKPLAVLSDTPKDSRSENYKWEERYENGLISFPIEIYESGKPPEAIPWNYNKKFYLYHPIQVFQLLHYLRGNSYENLKNNKYYKSFYWTRRLNFRDYLVDHVEKYLKRENKSKEQYIKEQSEEGYGFNRFDFEYFGQNRWLSEKELILWIKLESLYHVDFLRPSSRNKINITIQSTIWDNKEKVYQMMNKFDEWYNKIMDNFSEFFTSKDFKTVKEFIGWLESHTMFDGLNDFKDLFILIKNQKKNKLKRFMSLFVNLLQIIKVLKISSRKLIETFPELENEKIERKWFDQKYIFESDEEKTEYIQKVYLDYGLTQKDTYVLYVEGRTEVILLEEWLKYVDYRQNIKIDIKELPSGKSTAFIFEYLAKNFDASEHFLILDADKPEYVESKRNQLKGKDISGDSYHIFNPDFVTANFESWEILEAFKMYFNEISEIINKNREKKISLIENDLRFLQKMIEKKKESEKFEDILEYFLKIKFNTSFKKTAFAQHLLILIRDNLSKPKRDRIYHFEEIIGKFVTMIQKKQFPESVAKKLFDD